MFKLTLVASVLAIAAIRAAPIADQGMNHYYHPKRNMFGFGCPGCYQGVNILAHNNFPNTQFIGSGFQHTTVYPEVSLTAGSANIYGSPVSTPQQPVAPAPAPEQPVAPAPAQPCVQPSVPAPVQPVAPAPEQPCMEPTQAPAPAPTPEQPIAPVPEQPCVEPTQAPAPAPTPEQPIAPVPEQPCVEPTQAPAPEQPCAPAPAPTPEQPIAPAPEQPCVEPTQAPAPEQPCVEPTQPPAPEQPVVPAPEQPCVEPTQLPAPAPEQPQIQPSGCVGGAHIGPSFTYVNNQNTNIAESNYKENTVYVNQKSANTVNALTNSNTQLNCNA
ncbi:hypothetical protein COEREDRAFT_95877 [Coemansia reversa NRRL 1564]|uniref:Uncharacterized protein n=1 Tax=Coemansia reversa (strain ATCC 12441 / NRRL 1564) TaxID=763665 RepID=A0A2G5BI12_COERN|nr:hypothetical protein COEREDRAFT_95877 [Coemansia reversa NRRL 1564]|eukprot:PIA18668.1 hypothetical protein COEREDRAFT_95877 [Coemansia reversa NRRL 1564]